VRTSGQRHRRVEPTHQHGYRICGHGPRHYLRATSPPPGMIGTTQQIGGGPHG
jgi:hypothetical protein